MAWNWDVMLWKEQAGIPDHCRGCDIMRDMIWCGCEVCCGIWLCGDSDSDPTAAGSHENAVQPVLRGGSRFRHSWPDPVYSSSVVQLSCCMRISVCRSSLEISSHCLRSSGTLTVDSMRMSVDECRGVISLAASRKFRSISDFFRKVSLLAINAVIVLPCSALIWRFMPSLIVTGALLSEYPWEAYSVYFWRETEARRSGSDWEEVWDKVLGGAEWRKTAVKM